MENIDKRTKEYKEKHSREVHSAVIAPMPIAVDYLERLKAESIPCHYARFHQPVPPGKDREPVSEFKVGTADKYGVTYLLAHPFGGVIFGGVSKDGKAEEDMTYGANVIYVRF